MLYESPVLTAYFITITAMIGLVAGSFLNCAALRAISGQSVAKGRSRCPACGHTLGVLDLIPLFSWLFLLGKCRYCKSAISPRYPLTEFLTALVFVSALLRYDISVKTAELLLLGSILLYISFVDAKSHIIPDRMILAGIIVRAVFLLFSGDILGQALQSIIGGLSVPLPILLLTLGMEKLLKKEMTGGGDIKLLFMTGLYLDWKLSLLALLLACVFGIVFAVISRVRFGTPFPFGPAIALGTWITLLFGQMILSAYLGLFGL